MPASWFSTVIHITIHALTQPRRPIAGHGPETEPARSAMARILAADIAATVLGAHEAGVVGGTGPLLWRHNADGEESSAIEDELSLKPLKTFEQMSWGSTGRVLGAGGHVALYEWQHLRSSSFLYLSYTQPVGLFLLCLF